MSVAYTSNRAQALSLVFGYQQPGAGPYLSTAEQSVFMCRYVLVLPDCYWQRAICGSSAFPLLSRTPILAPQRGLGSGHSLSSLPRECHVPTYHQGFTLHTQKAPKHANEAGACYYSTALQGGVMVMGMVLQCDVQCVMYVSR